MKIALLQCNTVTGDVAGNAERILAAVREAAAQGADLCVTPELALCGVAPGSYLRAEDFAEGCKAGLQMLADALQDGPPLLVGAPVASVYASGLLSNAAILVQKGRWSVVSRKVYQTYGQDSEARFFDRGVSCGILALDGWRLGVVLCQESATEDGAFWKTQYASGHNPLMELVQRGVDAIVHMAAVPFSKGVQRLSEQMLSHVAARHHVHLFSVNMVGGNDSRVYNGQSLAFDPTGQILARGKAFAEDVLLVDTEVYSNTGGQSSKATPVGAVAQFQASGKKTKKKDLGMLLMNYDNVYVAQCAMGANPGQLIKALKEAEAHKGPSIVICYAPCINHGIKRGMSGVQQEMKDAVASGYWNLYRYSPETKTFTLDSKEPTMPLYDFMKGEVRYASLELSFPDNAKVLFAEAEEAAQEKYESYRRKAEK